MGFFKEFKEFAMKGNVMDMAIGVIIGGAFGKIVTSLVNDILMPLVGALIGNVNFTTLSATLRAPKLNEAGDVVAEAVTLNYGNFIQVTIDFLIVALCIFCVIKLINKASSLVKKQEEEAPAPAPEPSAEEKLLTEIRDLLKEK
ncbi:MAG: large-conductance mechanosensitive channel protein MscL [Bacteroidales bacterium]|nr:large-conductance mechanosensitive channel protein MscL [Bacteroidales bacterium]MBR4637372.1 large-conductance mechanosensitive channel protein MscL [Bacteroidales bacterium]MBR6175409.1 large-conductance mechanosensitive channel protein MscL [Bacteroidales bacterium]MBR6905274.1 large-conductance mechanosensitive channel protein MscL [Bacteroidales bacterium]